MTRFEAFWNVICDYRSQFWLGSMVLIFLFILSIISLLVGTPGTAAYVLTVLDLILIIVIGIPVSTVFYVCTKRRTKEY